MVIRFETDTTIDKEIQLKLKYMNRKRWSASLIRDIVDNIQDPEGNRIIPIIGQGVYQVNDNGKEYSIQQFIIKTVLENEKIPLQPTESNIDIFSNGYRGMTELSKLCSDNDLTLLRLIKELFGDKTNVRKISMDPDVLTFLERGDQDNNKRKYIFEGFITMENPDSAQWLLDITQYDTIFNTRKKKATLFHANEPSKTKILFNR